MSAKEPSVISRRGTLQGTLAAGLAAILPANSGRAQEVPINSQLSGSISPVHDPCIIRESDTYYVFSTDLGGGTGSQIPCRRSKDLRNWEKFGYVFNEIPDWALKAVPGTGGIWAPDISYTNGKYLLYYACSTFGKNGSAIGLATNTTLNPNVVGYAWKDEGLVFKSQPGDDFNAIDPNHVVDAQGNHWLAFGSFWGGIKLIQLDPATNKPMAGAPIHSLAKRPTDNPGLDAIEAAFIIERQGWYYLFCSFDFCCRAENSNYYTVVGRSRSITGPYGDRSRYAMSTGNGTVVLPHDPNARWRGPGGCSILRDAGHDYIAYHAYDARREGSPTLRIAPLVWSEDGWPTAII